MIYYTELKDAHSKPYRRKTGNFSDDIYTFDLEDTNLFYINGRWQGFDKSIENYSGVDMVAVPYIWQFGINGKVYFGYELSDFEKVLKKISNPKITKIIYVHNLSHEMQFLRDILDKYTVTDMIARSERRPISFYVPELNINFRCSYALTNLSLELSAERYTKVKKKSGDLDYNVLRSPLSARNMTEKELAYCEYDIITLYHIIRCFRDEYGHVRTIPYTQTGEVRRAFSKVVTPEWAQTCRDATPTVEEYRMLKAVSAGGYTHANVIYTGEVLKNGHSFDKSSDYPYQLCANKYPDENFVEIDADLVDMYPADEYAYIYYARFDNIKATKFNHYISYSKIDRSQNEVLDNGKIVCADFVEMWLTDADLECIKMAYKYDLTIIRRFVAHKDYLPKFYLEFILDLYENKTKLKNVITEYEQAIYKKSKEQINGVYGMAYTDKIRASVVYDTTKGEWFTASTDDDTFLQKKLDEEKQSRQNVHIYSIGIFCTAYARLEIFSAICHCDRDEFYSDTDSLKLLNVEKYLDYFEELNRICDVKLKAMCDARGIDFERTRPVDTKGNKHPLGWFEWETDGAPYEEFVTLGAKKYCYRQNGTLHLTVAGLGKGNARDGYSIDKLKNDIRNFNKNTKWGYDDAHKLNHFYNDDQPEIDFVDNAGNVYHSTQKHGVILAPNTYQMGLTFEYESLIEDLNEIMSQTMDFEKIADDVQTRKKFRRRNFRTGKLRG